ncbi:MAG TPA: undecaprenyl/decaprenyl-phosphate alpha-N-acetylglucosaminyl 1-phosphate transferase [Nitrospirae bacterium]|nr:undecaprenyl/decaprenyl-phosphate alpha-N-acetylglucosaminyl 1-phosphate transferase [Nitrospirota bacterium]
MKEFVLTIILSFAGSFLLLYKLIPVSVNFGFCDNPAGDSLKIHKKPIPYTGGIGIYTAFLITMGLFFSIFRYPLTREVMGIILCGGLIIALGLWDDKQNVNPKLRLVLQIAISGITVMTSLVFFKASIFVLLPLLIVYLVGSINSVNLFDGLDGLAGGTVAISLAGLGYIFYLENDFLYLSITFALLGALLAFLVFNFNPATVFLGDNGSTFLGYMLAILAINTIRNGDNLLLLFLTVLFVGLPVVDTAFAIIRRAIKGRPIFVGDRSHIYDLMVINGLSIKQAVLLCYVLQSVIVYCGVLLWRSFHFVSGNN